MLTGLAAFETLKLVDFQIMRDKAKDDLGVDVLPVPSLFDAENAVDLYKMPKCIKTMITRCFPSKKAMVAIRSINVTLRSNIVTHITNCSWSLSARMQGLWYGNYRTVVFHRKVMEILFASLNIHTKYMRHVVPLHFPGHSIMRNKRPFIRMVTYNE